MIELPIETLFGKSCKYKSVAIPVAPNGILLFNLVSNSSTKTLCWPFKFAKDDVNPVIVTFELLGILKYGKYFT